jgi:hypothetical protein
MGHLAFICYCTQRSDKSRLPRCQEPHCPLWKLKQFPVCNRCFFEEDFPKKDGQKVDQHGYDKAIVGIIHRQQTQTKYWYGASRAGRCLASSLGEFHTEIDPQTSESTSPPTRTCITMRSHDAPCSLFPETSAMGNNEIGGPRLA